MELIGPDIYPVRGAAVVDSAQQAGAIVWEIIDAYDNAEACNLVIHPTATGEVDQVRVFVFPRSRRGNSRIAESMLWEDEGLLLYNNRGGVYSEWSFAGVEMGLLTQVEWGPVFDEMSRNAEKWGRSLYRILLELTPDEQDEDWTDFRRAVSPHLTTTRHS